MPISYPMLFFRGHANGDEKSLPGNRISNVVAATLFPKSSKHLKEPVVITHKFAKVKILSVHFYVPLPSNVLEGKDFKGITP